MNVIKYAILDEFKGFLHSKYKSPATARQYYFWAVRLLEGQFFSNVSEIDIESMAKGLEAETKNRNEYSQAKNAFLNFAEFSHIQANIPALNIPKKRRHRKLKNRQLKNITHKVNVIQDKKLLLSYKIMLTAGLRVGELASITKKDIQPLENGGFSFVFKAKGGKIDKITIPAEQKYICDKIAKTIKPENSTDKAFYSAGYLQTNAKKRGFACHDLRRAFAKTDYKNSRDLIRTSERLRHLSPRTTRIYLKSKVEV